MNTHIFYCLLTILSLNFSLLAEANHKRIISIGPNITETLFALGLGDQIIGRDSASNYPAAAQKIKTVGGAHKFMPEGIIALQPTHVFLDTTRNPHKRLVSALQGAGVAVEGIKVQPSFEGSLASIRQIAKAVDQTEAAEKLIKSIKVKQQKLSERIAKIKSKSKSLFVYARGLKTVFVAGKNTAAEGLFKLAGLQNGISSFDNFRPLTSEAVVTSQAEVIVLFSSGLKSLGGVQNLKKIPGISLTPAAQANKIITVEEDAMLFGPRLLDFALELSQKVYGQ